MSAKPATEKVAENVAPAESNVRLRWDTSNLKSSYANVCNVTTTREEVVLNFGMNQAWERGRNEMEIQLTHRLVLSPFAAKRLSLMLTKLIGEYESRYGELKLEVAGSAGAPNMAEAPKQKQ